MPRALRRLLRPHAHVADALQRAIQLPRPPVCRMQRSRFEIVVRGAGLSREPLERCVALAEAIGTAARPRLAESRLFAARRAAGFAIRVTFEDEQLVATGGVLMRLSYVAAVHDTAETRRLAGPRALRSSRRSAEG